MQLSIVINSTFLVAHSRGFQFLSIMTRAPPGATGIGCKATHIDYHYVSSIIRIFPSGQFYRLI